MGLLGDIIGSAARAGGDIMERENKAALELENQKARADYQEELLRKREETARALKQEEEQRQASQYMQAEEEGGKRYSEAQYQKWRSDIGDSSASDEELRGVYDKSYKGKYQYADKLSEAKRYTVEALRGITNDSRLIKSAQDDYKQTAADERAAREADRKERVDIERERSNRATESARFAQAQASLKQAEAAMKRAEKSGDAQASAEAKTSVTAAGNMARSAMKDMTDSGQVVFVNGKPTSDSPEMLEEYKKHQRLLSQATQALTEKIGGKSSSSNDGANASTIPSGAVDLLKKDPSLKAQFESKYGKGSADKYLKN